MSAAPRWQHACLGILLLFAAAAAAAAAAEERAVAAIPTELSSVVASSLRHFPLVLAAEADIARQRGAALATEGVFDPRIEGAVGGRTSGFYDGRQLDTQLEQLLPFFNTKLFAGYRIADGSFPAYQGSDLTRDNGEARMGFAISLLRNRDIDERRAAVATTDLQVMVERQQLAAERLKVLRSAYVAYARWLLAHRLQEAYQGLLDIAVQRGEGLETSVAAGNAAAILLVENQQSVVQRQGLIVDAQRQIDVAAEQLALYLRDDDGQPMTPLYDLALALPAEDPALFSTPVGRVIDAVLELRPEVAIARVAQQQARIRKQAALNLAKPQLDLRVYTTRDFGAGARNLAGTDNVVDFSVSIPLRTREATGKATAAQAEVDGLEHRIQLLEDQVALDIRSALVNLEATRQLEAFAVSELDLSTQLATAEQQRFDAGQSDFFLLNQRERQMGEALLKRWQAYLIHQIALADYYAASMDLQSLGADPATVLLDPLR
ncbi:MAG: hypothetical protein RLZZ169_479 [Pseudomonadota bacterium]